MYTSGTTGDPKGVIMLNETFMTEVLSIDHILMSESQSLRTISLEASLVSCCIRYTTTIAANR